MHAHTIHIITQCNQIMNSKNINVLSVKVKIKSHENVIISGTYHYMYINTTVFDTPTSPTDMSGDIVCRTGESC